MNFTNNIFKRILLVAALGPGFIASSHAVVKCKINGQDIAVSDAMAKFDYSGSGILGRSGRISLFRLLTLDEGNGALSNIDLKAVNITAPGDYDVSTASDWRSVINDRGSSQKVTRGVFHFSRFAMQGFSGSAVGTVEFTTDRSSGSCAFNVEMTGMDRDRL